MPYSYPFPTYSGLFEPKHYKQIGTALWFFLWCISSTTKEEEADGVTWGLVLGNKPMKLSELAEPFGVDDKTVSRWLKALEEHSYIRVTRAPYGLIIAVRNSKKFRERADKNVRSDEREQTKMSDLQETDQTEMSDLPDKNVRSNKDIIKILNTTTTDGESLDSEKAESEDLPLIQIVKAYCKLHDRFEHHVRVPEREIMGKMIAGGVPSSFIIPTMIALREEKRRRDEEHGLEYKEPKSFRYYEEAIWEAWQNEQRSITTTVPTGGVALGTDRKPLPSRPRGRQEIYPGAQPPEFVIDDDDPITQLMRKVGAEQLGQSTA